MYDADGKWVKATVGSVTKVDITRLFEWQDGAVTFGAGTAVMGGGFAATVGAGMISGVTAGQAGRAADNVVNRRAITSGLGNARDIGRDALTGGVTAGLGYGVGRIAQAIARRTSVAGGVPCSFDADTPVLTNRGEQPISELAVDDLVWAYNEDVGASGWYSVTAVLIHQDPLVVHLTVDDETIDTTPEHPFYTEEHGWVPAGELWPGATVRRADGSHGIVQTVAVVEQPQLMYNLTVAEAHTFFVGQGTWLVHNTCPIPRPGTTNPYGRRGSPAHQARISQAEQRLKANNWITIAGGSQKERLIGGRYPDLVMSKGGRTIAIQVGRVTKRGLPVWREQLALQALRRSRQFDHVFYLRYR